VPFKSADPVLSSTSLGEMLQSLGLVLLVVFAISVLAATFPIQVLDAQWQLGLVSALVNNASLALVGGLLLPLGHVFDASNEKLRRKRALVRTWAKVVAIGFLLLIPVQIVSGLNYFRSFTTSIESQTNQSSKKLSAVRDAIATAPSPDELQTRMQKLLGPTAVLSPVQRRLPLAELRQQLLQQTEMASNQLQRRLDAQNRIKPDRAVKDSLRVIALAISYALGFFLLGGAFSLEGKRSSIRKN